MILSVKPQQGYIKFCIVFLIRLGLLKNLCDLLIVVVEAVSFSVF
jgi:hypothetical protein